MTPNIFHKTPSCNRGITATLYQYLFLFIMTWNIRTREYLLSHYLWQCYHDHDQHTTQLISRMMRGSPWWEQSINLARHFTETFNLNFREFVYVLRMSQKSPNPDVPMSWSNWNARTMEAYLWWSPASPGDKWSVINGHKRDRMDNMENGARTRHHVDITPVWNILLI